MKKAFVIIGAIVFVAFGLGSCKKCTTCKAVLTSSGVVQKEYTEQCGNSREISDYKKDLETSWPATQGYKIECTDK
ncbi:MAG: hypothetical protein V2A54_13940 [Bacteroidota bacterium]